MLLVNDRFNYRANGHAGLKGGTCWLRLYSDRHGAVAIVTELDSNTGPSVTNAIESIARGVRGLLSGYGVPADHPLQIVEHYDDRISYGRTGPWLRGVPVARYSSVTFGESGVPSWMPLSYGDVLGLIGDGLIDLPEMAR